jgi:hypothetical protein
LHRWKTFCRTIKIVCRSCIVWITFLQDT